MAGAAILDADKPVMHYFGRNPFPKAVRQIHARAQNESPEGLPNEIVFGLSCAITDAVIVVNRRRRHSSKPSRAITQHARMPVPGSRLKQSRPK